MALHFSVNVPSASAVHVVVMSGSSVSYSFCMFVYTTLTAMQSLHVQSNCVYMHVCECVCVLLVFHYIFCFIPVCIIYSSHIPLAAPPFIVRCQTHSWWSLEYLC